MYLGPGYNEFGYQFENMAYRHKNPADRFIVATTWENLGGPIVKTSLRKN
jgi:PIN domain nuclease of toxin-antitoxin system